MIIFARKDDIVEDTKLRIANELMLGTGDKGKGISSSQVPRPPSQLWDMIRARITSMNK